MSFQVIERRVPISEHALGSFSRQRFLNRATRCSLLFLPAFIVVRVLKNSVSSFFFFNLTVPLFHLIPEGSATAVTMLSGIDTFSSQALGDAASVLLPSHCVRRRQAAITPCVESSLLPPQSSFWFW